MYNEIMKKEMNEAIKAGERALSSLKAAEKKLNSASNWGMIDMFGGETFSTLLKNSKMSDAKKLMKSAESELKKFQKELQDVNIPLDLKMEVGNFLTFADFFFDGLIADVLVQNKISNAKNEVSNAIYQVEHILNELKCLV